jgi:transcriptional regulator with XRE-family HTH domain
MKNKGDLTFGARIRSLRLEKNMGLEELAERTGYPAELISQVEEGMVAPPVALVLQLGRAFKVAIEQIQADTDKEASKRRSRSHKKRVASYAYTALNRPGSEQHLRAYRVTLDPLTDHKGVEYHHEGEEFIYVLEGSLAIQVGHNLTALEKGGSIHFDSSIHHTLSNPGARSTELLVVIYVP